MARLHELRTAVNLIERWRNCPSTHCERAQECRSPHECSSTGKRRDGHSKLVWDKDAQTLKTVDPHPSIFHTGRPAGSNADEWHLFLSQYLDNRAGFPTGLTYVAVQIAEAIESAMPA